MNVILPLLFWAMAELPASADVAPVPVAGVVVDASGRPAQNAEVWLTRAVRSEDERRSAGALSWHAFIRNDESTVAVRSRTDEQGRFRIEVSAAIAARSDPIALAVWAFHGEEAVTIRRLPRALRADDPPDRLPLGTATRSKWEIHGPDGQPIASARVRPAEVREIPLPEALARQLEVTTDPEGRCTLPGLPRDAIGALRVQSPASGIQHVAVSGNTSTTLTLAQVGRVAGRLVAPEGFAQPIQGVRIRVRSQVGGFDGSGISGEAEAACDASGNFEIPAIAAGLLTVEILFDREHGTPLRGEPPRGLVLRAGSSVEVAIPLRATVLVRGVVRDKETKKPVAGVKLVMNGEMGGDTFAISDAAGNYSAHVVRGVGQPFGWAIQVPRPFFEPRGARETPQSMPARDRAELELPPIELTRGLDLAGVVVDESGKPVGDADVEVVYGQENLTRADPQGRFLLRGVDPRLDLKIEARKGAATSGRTTIVRAGNLATGALSLTLHEAPWGGIRGRVVDRAGQPIERTAVRIWRQIPIEGRTFLREPAAGEDGAIVFRTDANGRFRSTRPLPLGDDYVVEVTASGHLPARTAAIRLAGGDQAVPDITLPGLRTVTGQVADRTGRPLGGVRVLQSGDGPLRTETTTDESGRFQLGGVMEGPAFVFASREGYRSGFQAIGADSTPVKLTLLRGDEPPIRKYRTLDSALPADQEKTLARRLIEPYVRRVLDHGSDQQKFRMVMNAAQVDALVLLDKFETIKFRNSDFSHLARVRFVEGLAKENPDEALAQAEVSTLPEARAISYVSIWELQPELDRAKVRELVDQALLNARAIKSPEQRIAISADRRQAHRPGRKRAGASCSPRQKRWRAPPGRARPGIST